MGILIYLGAGYTLLGNSTITILFGALCAPRKGQSFFESYSSSICVDNVQNVGVASGIVNLVGDFYILILPLPLVSKLQLPKKRKISLLVIFMTGLMYDLWGSLFNAD